MKILKAVTRSILITVLFFVTINKTQAQDLKLVNEESTLKIYGTSNIHDWEEDAENQSGKITFSDIENGQVDYLFIEIEAESLKSGKGAMDKNTYKALNTDKHKKITFQSTNIQSITPVGNGVFNVKTTGDLTISGTKKSISLDFKLTIKGAKVTLEGENKIKMTDFKVEPPTALFGSITTGDALTIKFTTNFK